MEHKLLTSKSCIENKELIFSLSKSFSANLRRLDEYRKKDKNLDFIMASVLDVFGYTGEAAEMLQLKGEREQNHELKRRYLTKATDLFCKVKEYFEAGLICKNNWEKLNDNELRQRARDLNNKVIEEEGETTRKARESLKDYCGDSEFKEIIEFIKVGDLLKAKGSYGVARHSYSMAYTYSKGLLDRGLKDSEKERIKSLMIEACYSESKCYEEMGMPKYALNALNMNMPECKDQKSILDLKYEKERLSKKIYELNSFDFCKTLEKEQSEMYKEQESKTAQTKQNSQKTEGLKENEKEIKLGNLTIEKF